MKIDALQAFVLTAEFRSLSAAALAMGCAKPKLLQWFKQLEQLWCTPLFEVSGDNYLATQPVKGKLHMCRQLINQIYRPAYTDSVTPGSPSGLLRLAVSAWIEAEAVERAITRFTRRYPTVTLEMVTLANDDLCNAQNLWPQTLALCLLFPNQTSKHEKTILATKTLYTVCGERHALAGMTAITNETLLGYPVIDIEGAIESQVEPGPFPENYLRVTSQESAIERAKAGQGWMRGGAGQLKDHLARGELQLVDHPGAAQECQLAVLSQTGGKSTLPQAWLRECLRLELAC